MLETIAIAEEAPFPPRHWWLKRIVLAYALLLIALLGLRLWWGSVAHSRLETEIAKYKAAGEPIEPEDFNPKDEIPDAENVAVILEQAEAALPPQTLEATG